MKMIKKVTLSSISPERPAGKEGNTLFISELSEETLEVNFLSYNKFAINKYLKFGSNYN